MRRPLIRAALLLALVLPHEARADPKDDARRHFGEGLTAAQSGDYDLALQHFLAAQEAYPHPATLYNIAKSYQDLNDPANALVYYQLYRDELPEKAAEIDPIIASLEARLAPAAPLPAAPVSAGPAVSAANAEDLERLREISRQLEALATDLAQRAPAAPSEAPAPALSETPAPESPPPTPTSAPTLISEAYEKVVVSASRVGLAPLDSPSSVTILSADDIRATPALSVADVLRRVVGVDAMSLSAAHTEVSIRGFNHELSNKVLVLIDGRSTYVDVIGSTLWAGLPITLDEIERIEVIRGPASAVYGANAVTGVINIITRTPGEGENVVRVQGGTPGIAHVSAVTTGRASGSGYRFSAAYDTHGVWARPVTDGAPVVTLTDDLDQSLETLRANGRIDHPFGERGLLSVSGGLNEGTYEFYNLGALGDFGLTDTLQSYARADLAWDPVHLRVFWNGLNGTTGPWVDAEGSNHSLISPVRNDVIDAELEAPLSFTTGPVQHSLNLGVGYRFKRFQFGYFDGGYDNPYAENHFALFVNEAATVDAVTVVGSLRADRHPLLDPTKTLSPRGSVIVRVLDKTSLRATAGTSFRAPTPVETYMRVDLASTSANGAFIEDFGNQDLLPERILTLEAGVHDESSFYHTADLTVFYNRVTHLIGLEPVVLGPNPFDPESNGFETGETGWANLTPVYGALGAELDTELYPLDGLDLYANLALTRITETDDGVTVVDGSTSLVKVNGGATWRTPWRIDASLGAHYVSAQVWRLREFTALGDIALTEAPLAARLLPEARLAFRPLPEQGLELAIDAWNFTALGQTPPAADAADTRQEHPKGQPLGGRLYGSATYRF